MLNPKNETAMKKITDMSDAAKKKYAELFEKALAAMESAKWQKPWVTPNLGTPRNLYRQDKPYRGVNYFLLSMLGSIEGFKTPYYVTWNEMTDEGRKYGGLSLQATLKTGEDGMPLFNDKGLPIFDRPLSFPVWKYLPRIKDKDGNRLTQDEYDALTEEEQQECRTFFSLFVYNVWNLDQTDFAEKYPDAYRDMTAIPEHEYTHGQRDEVLERMITGGEWRCNIEFKGHEAFYTPSGDYIRLPERQQFLSDELFYGTALHEMAHSTAKEVGRKVEGSFGSESYAREEFVAELTSACVCSLLGVGKLLDKQHLAYVASWRKALKDDKNFIMDVIDDVQRAVNYILRQYEAVRMEMEGTAAPLAA